MWDEPLVKVFDDDNAVRESLDFLLSTTAFADRTYETATPAWTVGCVTTEFRMPEMTGIELLALDDAAGHRQHRLYFNSQRMMRRYASEACLR